MSELDLFQAIGELDDGILEDAEAFLRGAPPKRRAPVWVKWGGLAACAAAVVCAVWALRPADEPGQPAQTDVPPPPKATQSAPNVDRPAVEPEELKQLPVEMDWNHLTEAPPEGTAALFALLWDDFVPMTRAELLDYYGVTLPVEETLPPFLTVGPEEGDDGFGRGIYRTGERGVYFDTNTFAFALDAGEVGMYITLDKAFHLPTAPWELPGDSLNFTAINGWELALFLYPDGEGNQVFYTEFTQNGVNYRVTGKNMCEQEYAAVLSALLERRDDFAPGQVRTVTGTYTGGLSRQTLTETQPDGGVSTQVTYGGILGLHLDDGNGLRVELTPEQAEEFYGSLSLGDQVTVSFTGEPATAGTVWTRQLVRVAKGEGA